MVLLPAPFLVQQGASRAAIQQSGMSRAGLGGSSVSSERVKWDIVVTGSHSRMRERGLRGHPVGEVPRIPAPVRVIIDVCGLLERKHEAVDQDRGHASCY